MAETWLKLLLRVLGGICVLALILIGVVAGVRAGVPAYLVIGDALGCWVFLLPILVLARRFNRERP
jgi:hypothetical protein